MHSKIIYRNCPH
jgi:ribonuclease HI